MRGSRHASLRPHGRHGRWLHEGDDERGDCDRDAERSSERRGKRERSRLHTAADDRRRLGADLWAAAAQRRRHVHRGRDGRMHVTALHPSGIGGSLSGNPHDQELGRRTRCCRVRLGRRV